jgi:hypothetical protein
MILSPPIPWSDVPAGAQVLIDGVPRTVLQNNPHRDWGRRVLAEGLGPQTYVNGAAVQLVIMDEADAVANLLAAGFTAAPIEE